MYDARLGGAVDKLLNLLYSIHASNKLDPASNQSKDQMARTSMLSVVHRLNLRSAMHTKLSHVFSRLLECAANER
jgi:hypothetical protein